VSKLGRQPERQHGLSPFTADRTPTALLAAVRRALARAQHLVGRASTELDGAERLEATRPAGLSFASARRNPGFIAGADVNEFRRRDRFRPCRDRDRPRPCGDRPPRSLKIPTVAVIHGFLPGWRPRVALACQSRIAIDGRALVFRGAARLHPGLGGTRVFTTSGQSDAAMTLMLTGKTIDRARAKSLGLVDAVAQERHVRNAVNGRIVRPLEVAPGRAL